MSYNTLLELYNYNAYANGLVLDTAAQLNEDEFKRDSGMSRGSVYMMLLHIMGAEWRFLERCQEKTPTQIDPAQFPTLTDIRNKWRDVANELCAYLEQARDEDLDKVIQFPLMNKEFRLSKRELLMQAFGHSTTHRGELSILLTELGHPVPNMDAIIFFVKQSGQQWG